jgi:hypothetical protein
MPKAGHDAELLNAPDGSLEFSLRLCTLGACKDEYDFAKAERGGFPPWRCIDPACSAKRAYCQKVT